ncbi:13181_t:CDS:2 [Acaulospora colombiana]|uniref:13181_t:CDS:1 n=1 Tax=Acaulospora colombiana TaxID=27376 RepID=A0ACA9L2R8_9GLOM|nr:13181_t:CDS:2 [Acaulospora colombiana]
MNGPEKGPPSRRSERDERAYVVELFKLYLGEEHQRRPHLAVNYERAIIDYLREIGICIKEKITTNFPEIGFLENVLLVLTIPAEYSEEAKATMRDCAYKAGLIRDRTSEQLQFTTEPEAAAIYCIDSLREHDLDVGATFMIVDCGGGTVDLTTRKLLEGGRLGEITERIGDYCGSTFIDAEFIKYLKNEHNLGDAIDSMEINYYGQMQYLIQEFCRYAKLPFTGDDPNFYYEVDLEVLSEYANDEVKEAMGAIDWVVKLDSATIKSMFDPIVERILRMIHIQLDNSHEECSVMFLVGGFGQSAYLRNRIRQEFQHRVRNISAPTNPIAAISRGAAIYGRSFRGADGMIDIDGMKSIIDSRVLKFTYGVKVLSVGSDEETGGKFRFSTIVQKGTEVSTDEGFGREFSPALPFQKSALFEIYYTRRYEAKSIDEPGIRLLGKLKIDLPDVNLGTERPVAFRLTFGRMEITATANNKINGQSYQTTFEIDREEQRINTF